MIAGPAIVLHCKGTPDGITNLFGVAGGSVPTFFSGTVGVDVEFVGIEDEPIDDKVDKVVPIDCTLASDLLVELDG